MTDDPDWCVWCGVDTSTESPECTFSETGCYCKEAEADNPTLWPDPPELQNMAGLFRLGYWQAQNDARAWIAAADAAQERPKWVRVADVPDEWKDGRPCLIYRPDGNPLVCEDWFMDDSDGWLKGTTHVMPMPKGPRDCIPRDAP
jgi:hypothetical protein